MISSATSSGGDYWSDAGNQSGAHQQKWVILPLSHKSSRLCWGRPLTVSDAFGDGFFEILSVFWVEVHFLFFFWRTTLHDLAASKKVARPKMAIFDVFPEGGGWGHYEKQDSKNPRIVPYPKPNPRSTQGSILRPPVLKPV